MTAVEAHAWIGSLVRIAPLGRPRMSYRHHMPGRLLGVEGSKAVVVPFGHGRPERIELQHVKSWKSRAALVRSSRLAAGERP